jgi:hypothetical protein
MGFNYSWNQIERMHEDALLDAYLEDDGYEEDEDEYDEDEEEDDDD